ncbi:MAG: glycosyltransferase family 4 protein, partial [Armatimonadota bacterium]|nr:glycosyltransferase family 4 protein [Armatimonadota bacterium]
MNAYPNLAKRHKVAYVGTYPPKECGIATFTMDMLNATDLSGWRSIVLEVNDAAPDEPHPDKKVVFTIEKENRASYRQAAKLLDEHKVSLLSIQHEYGIFGGEDGDYVLDLARAASMPIVITLHTVLPKPSESQRRIVQDLAKYTASFVVMANKGVELLRDVYGIRADQIQMIPHGAPNTPFGAEKAAKAKFGLQGKRVLSTFGLISPNKGIEDAIAAMPAVVAQEPNATYLVLGQTHPVIKRKEGEWYRDQLVQQAHDLGMENNVTFVDRYLTLQQLIDYLLATDIYITPYYANPHQITSGTLAYAMATGKVIVSTPYLYAQEILSEGRGFLYPFRDTQALSQIIETLLTDPALYEKTRRKAYEFGRSMTWQSVGLQYTRLFTEMLNERWVNHRAAVDAAAIPGLSDMVRDGELWAPPPVASQ